MAEDIKQEGDPTPPLDCSSETLMKFFATLEVGEKVIEMGESCQQGQVGEIVQGNYGKGIMWAPNPNMDDDQGQPMTGRMVTSLTGGARRLKK